MKTLHPKAKALTKRLLNLEKCGEYEKALAEVRHIWEDTNVLPNTNGFEPQTAAEIILRCGSLIGFLGHIKQIPNAQEKSKNLLGEAHRRFLDIYNVEKIAECENYLALAYWRTGELNEAEIWIEQSLSHDLSSISKARLYSYIIESKIDFAKRNYEKICRNFTHLKIFFSESDDNFLKASYYNHFGLALKNLGSTDEALPYIEKARDCFYKIKHHSFAALCENNLSQIYKSQKDFLKAHLAVDNATETFKIIKDKIREGFSLDTKAQIYFAERKYAEALETVEKAISILQKGENPAYLVETYLTKVKILVYLDDFSSATLCLSDAVQLAKSQISETVCMDLVREFELVIQERNSDYFPIYLRKMEAEFEKFSKDNLESFPRKLEKVNHKCDVALSFAGENRDFVKEVYKELHSQNISVFYDFDDSITVDSWGKDLNEIFEQVFRESSKYVVVFISEHYARKKWTKYEFRCALAKGVEEKNVYILPAHFDDTKLPGLLPTVASVDLRQETPQSFANKIINKF